MALGNYQNNTQRNNVQDLTVYGTFRLSNDQGEIGHTALSFKMWHGLLCASIAPLIAGADGIPTVDKDHTIEIYLTPMKANILAQEIKSFKEGKCKNVGVNTSKGVICITDGSEYGVNCPCLSIYKVDPNTGATLDKIAYQFRMNYHFSIRNFKENAGAAPSFDKYMKYDDIELDMFTMQLEEFVRAMTDAIGYSANNIAYRHISRLDTKLNKICESMNISTGYQGGGNRKSSPSFFDTKPGNLAASTDNSDFDNDYA